MAKPSKGLFSGARRNLAGKAKTGYRKAFRKAPQTKTASVLKTGRSMAASVAGKPIKWTYKFIRFLAFKWPYGTIAAIVLTVLIAGILTLINYVAASGGFAPPIYAGQSEQTIPGGEPTGQSSDIPDTYMQAYLSAAVKYDVPWQLLAAWGDVATNHGRRSPYDCVWRVDNTSAMAYSADSIGGLAESKVKRVMNVPLEVGTSEHLAMQLKGLVDTDQLTSAQADIIASAQIVTPAGKLQMNYEPQRGETPSRWRLGELDRGTANPAWLENSNRKCGPTGWLHQWCPEDTGLPALSPDPPIAPPEYVHLGTQGNISNPVSYAHNPKRKCGELPRLISMKTYALEQYQCGPMLIIPSAANISCEQLQDIRVAADYAASIIDAALKTYTQKAQDACYNPEDIAKELKCREELDGGRSKRALKEQVHPIPIYEGLDKDAPVQGDLVRTNIEFWTPHWGRALEKALVQATGGVYIGAGVRCGDVDEAFESPESAFGRTQNDMRNPDLLSYGGNPASIYKYAPPAQQEIVFTMLFCELLERGVPSYLDLRASISTNDGYAADVLAATLYTKDAMQASWNWSNWGKAREECGSEIHGNSGRWWSLPSSLGGNEPWGNLLPVASADPDSSVVQTAVARVEPGRYYTCETYQDLRDFCLAGNSLSEYERLVEDEETDGLPELVNLAVTYDLFTNQPVYEIEGDEVSVAGADDAEPSLTDEEAQEQAEAALEAEISQSSVSTLSRYGTANFRTLSCESVVDGYSGGIPFEALFEVPNLVARLQQSGWAGTGGFKSDSWQPARYDSYGTDTENPVLPAVCEVSDAKISLPLPDEGSQHLSVSTNDIILEPATADDDETDTDETDVASPPDSSNPDAGQAVSEVADQIATLADLTERFLSLNVSDPNDIDQAALQSLLDDLQAWRDTPSPVAQLPDVSEEPETTEEPDTTEEEEVEPLTITEYIASISSEVSVELSWTIEPGQLHFGGSLMCFPAGPLKDNGLEVETPLVFPGLCTVNELPARDAEGNETEGRPAVSHREGTSGSTDGDQVTDQIDDKCGFVYALRVGDLTFGIGGETKTLTLWDTATADSPDEESAEAEYPKIAWQQASGSEQPRSATCKYDTGESAWKCSLVLFSASKTVTDVSLIREEAISKAETADRSATASASIQAGVRQTFWSPDPLFPAISACVPASNQAGDVDGSEPESGICTPDSDCASLNNAKVLDSCHDNIVIPDSFPSTIAACPSADRLPTSSGPADGAASLCNRTSTTQIQTSPPPLRGYNQNLKSLQASDGNIHPMHTSPFYDVSNPASPDQTESNKCIPSEYPGEWQAYQEASISAQPSSSSISASYYQTSTECDPSKELDFLRRRPVISSQSNPPTHVIVPHTWVGWQPRAGYGDYRIQPDVYQGEVADSAGLFPDDRYSDNTTHGWNAALEIAYRARWLAGGIQVEVATPVVLNTFVASDKGIETRYFQAQPRLPAGQVCGRAEFERDDEGMCVAHPSCPVHDSNDIEMLTDDTGKKLGDNQEQRPRTETRIYADRPNIDYVESGGYVWKVPEKADDKKRGETFGFALERLADMTVRDCYEVCSNMNLPYGDQCLSWGDMAVRAAFDGVDLTHGLGYRTAEDSQNLVLDRCFWLVGRDGDEIATARAITFDRSVSDGERECLEEQPGYGFLEHGTAVLLTEEPKVFTTEEEGGGTLEHVRHLNHLAGKEIQWLLAHGWRWGWYLADSDCYEAGLYSQSCNFRAWGRQIDKWV